MDGGIDEGYRDEEMREGWREGEGQMDGWMEGYMERCTDGGMRTERWRDRDLRDVGKER